MLTEFLLLLALTPGVTSLSLQEIDAEWGLFKVKFNRTYNSWREEKFRYRVFTETFLEIYLHNMAADKGRYSYWLGINNFADLTSEEFNDMYTGLKVGAVDQVYEDALEIKYRSKLTDYQDFLPDYVDWRTKNCVTPVKYQGNCRSCYAFAATGALEGLNCIKSGTLVSLSEQNILDCSTIYGNNGCNDGLPDNAFEYAVNKGVDTEQSYPYRGAMGECELLRGTFAVRADGFQDVYPRGKEYKLQEAVALEGPVSVCFDTKGEGKKFQQYDHGVYHNSECKETRTDLTHAMLVVGYNTTEDGNGYWIVKNSYDTCWGMNGYILVARNGENTCGIATLASFPTIWE